MWSNDELIRLALEAVCLISASIAAALIARRGNLWAATLVGVAAGVLTWLILLAIQLRFFAKWS